MPLSAAMAADLEWAALRSAALLPPIAAPCLLWPVNAVIVCVRVRG